MKKPILVRLGCLPDQGNAQSFLKMEDKISAKNSIEDTLIVDSCDEEIAIYKSFEKYRTA